MPINWAWPLSLTLRHCARPYGWDVSAPRRQGPRSPQRRRRVAAFFDLDKTIIATSSVFAFNKSFLDEGMLSRRSVIDLAYTQLAFSLSDADDEQMNKVRQAMATATKG